MIFGVSASDLPAGLPFGPAINAAATANNFPPCWLYAHGWQETIKVSGWIASLGKTAETFISDDGGHGLFQLTASFPDDWQDPQANAAYAVTKFLQPAISFWTGKYGLVGDPLIKCVAAEFNGGRANAEAGYKEGDAGKFTTQTGGVSYAALVVKYYHQLSGGLHPSG